jgi:hypothetical protein
MMLSRRVRHAWAVIACCLLMALGACGPGTVGTGSGTDESGSDNLQFEPLGVCSTPFADTGLACGPGDPANLEPGTAAVRWADAGKTNQGATVLVALEGRTLGLQIACVRANFLGAWGRLPDGTLAFVGRYDSPDAPNGQPAITRVEPAPGEPDAVGWLQVDDGSGATLFGPWLVRRVEGAVEFQACPP